MHPLPRTVRRLLLVVTIAAVGVLAGCSSSSDQTAADVAGELRELSGDALTEEQAQCVAEGLLDAFGDEDFARVIAAAQNLTEGDGSGDVRTEVINIWAGCDAIGALLDDEPDTDVGADDGEA